jgi:hypothetical protein
VTGIGRAFLSHPHHPKQGIAAVVFQADHIAGAKRHTDPFDVSALIAQILRTNNFQEGMALRVRTPKLHPKRNFRARLPATPQDDKPPLAVITGMLAACP